MLNYILLVQNIRPRFLTTLGLFISHALIVSGIGRVLDSRPKGRGFEPHRRQCVVSLSKTHLSLLSTGYTQEEPPRNIFNNFDWDVKNQIKGTNKANH